LTFGKLKALPILIPLFILEFQPADISQFSNGYFFRIIAIFLDVGSIFKLSKYLVAYSYFISLTKCEFPARFKSLKKELELSVDKSTYWVLFSLI